MWSSLFKILVILYILEPSINVDEKLVIVSILYSIFGFFILFLFYKYRVYLYTPYLIVLLFIFSFINRLNIVLKEESLLNLGGHYTTGNFISDYASVVSYIELSVIGLIAMLIGILVANFKGELITYRMEAINNQIIYKNVFILIILIRIILIFICDQLNINKSGIVPEELPFKITGILVYLSNIILPILTTYMCLVAITNNQNRLFNGMALASFLIGLLSAYITGSKGSLILAFIPIFLYLTDEKLTQKKLQRYYAKYILILILILIATYVVIDYKRNINETEFYNLNNLWIFIHKYETGTIGPIEAIIQSIMLRITGGNELMAIMNSSSNYENTIINLIFNKSFIFYELPLLIKDIFNINVGINENISIGKTIGLFGLAYLSKNLILYTFIMLSFGILIGIYERSIKFIIGKTASIILSLYLLINLWEGGLDVLFLYLTLPIVLYIFNLIINNSRVVNYYIK